MRAEDQLVRLLGLVPWLRARPGVQVSDAAAAFGITPKQLVDDLNMLWLCGLPGGLPDDLIEIDMEAVEDEGVIHLTNADYLSRPMRLRPDEALGLVVALQSLAELAPTSSREAVLSARDKLTGLLGTSDVPVAVEVVAGEDGAREALIAAAEARECVQLAYHGPRRSTAPVVEPVRIDVVDGFAYLTAWSRTTDGWRTFRLDRVESVTPTGEHFTDRGEPPAGGDWFASPLLDLTVRLRPAAHWVVEYFPTTSVIDQGDDLVVTFPVTAASWAVSLVLRLGPDAEVVAPREIAEAARAEARLALTMYEQG